MFSISLIYEILQLYNALRIKFQNSLHTPASVSRGRGQALVHHYVWNSKVMLEAHPVIYFFFHSHCSSNNT